MKCQSLWDRGSAGVWRASWENTPWFPRPQRKNAEATAGPQRTAAHLEVAEYLLVLDCCNSFIEIEFICHASHPSKVHHLMVFSIFRVVQPSPQSVLEHFHYSKKKL